MQYFHSTFIPRTQSKSGGGDSKGVEEEMTPGPRKEVRKDWKRNNQLILQSPVKAFCWQHPSEQRKQKVHRKTV